MTADPASAMHDAINLAISMCRHHIEMARGLRAEIEALEYAGDHEEAALQRGFLTVETEVALARWWNHRLLTALRKQRHGAYQPGLPL